MTQGMPSRIGKVGNISTEGRGMQDSPGGVCLSKQEGAVQVSDGFLLGSDLSIEQVG